MEGRKEGVWEERKGREMRNEGTKEGWKKRRQDLLVLVFVDLFGERDSFSYGRHIRYVNREGIKVISYNIRVD